MTVLVRTHSTLPSASYRDPDTYARELAAIWYREWVCAGRESDWAQHGDYRVVSLGDQSIVVLRDRDGCLQAFHNTCRHRGSLLCEQQEGRFAGRIVCPYHAWTYALDGSLRATPRRVPSADFSPGDYSLYPVRVDTWGGFVFINLAGTSRSGLPQALGAEAAALASWPLASLQLAHREIHHLACNWKIFWENFLECYHCPGVHPELCRLVPVYGMGLLGLDEDPDFDPSANPEVAPRVAPGKQTWSMDGELLLPPLAGVDPAMIAEGMRFATGLPSMFVVAHRDHVRAVRLRPIGPEASELCVEWLVAADLDLAAVDCARLTRFGRTVVMQDARVCELVQRGLRCRDHASGVLVAQEYDVLAFDQWVLERLRDADSPPASR